jgi:hypothetical protein
LSWLGTGWLQEPGKGENNMATQHKSGQERNFRILVQCPATGKRVLGDKLTHFAVPGAKAAWWNCPQCKSWHVSVYLEEKETGNEVVGTKVKSLNFSPV